MWLVVIPWKRKFSFITLTLFVVFVATKANNVLAGPDGLCMPTYQYAAPCCVPSCGPSYYRAGDLQVFVVGKKKNRLEIFFKDNFRGLDLEEASWLNCRNQISLASASEWGVCALRYGKKLSKFIACGWEKSESLSYRSHVYYSDKEGPDIDERYAVRFKWITPRILRVKYGKCAGQYCILKYVGGDKDPWVVLYQTNQNKSTATTSSIGSFIRFLW